MKTRVVVLGAGFGGLELTTILSDALGDAIDIVLIDKDDAFVFGFSKLDVMFGRKVPADVRHPYRDIVKPGVRFLQSPVRSIDPVASRCKSMAPVGIADCGSRIADCRLRTADGTKRSTNAKSASDPRSAAASPDDPASPSEPAIVSVELPLVKRRSRTRATRPSYSSCAGCASCTPW